MFDLGGGELLLIVLVILILFGPKKLPELAQSLGKGLREFKRAQREFTEQINMAVHEEEQRKPRASMPPPENVVARPKPTRTSYDQPAISAAPEPDVAPEHGAAPDAVPSGPGTEPPAQP